MLSFVLPVVLILSLVGLLALCTWAMDEDHVFLWLISGVLAIATFIGIIGFTINACDYGDYLMNPDVRIEATMEKRDSLVQLLSNYNLMMEHDVNASESYITIYKDVRDFNDAVRRANHWQDTWWAEGWLYDPTYVGLNTIPIN